MYDDSQKFRYYRMLVYILAFILLFEVGMLAWAIPVKTTFITITLAALGFLCLYLIVLCLRLIKELQGKSEEK
ncbi:hypothetical protein LJB87_00565 [Alistipes sp. OttesenSCG-928-L06]|nr:hypothetical protein [Alistipes sp. OttesenSCG-928-L06]